MLLAADCQLEGGRSPRERVEAVGGTLAVTSGASGTRLLARVPLPDEGGEP